VNFGELLVNWPVHDMEMPIRVRTEAGDYDIAAAHQRTEDGVLLALLDLGAPLDGQTELFKG
jgi:hypothetical protein